jgi:hypothetical protein
LEELMSGTGTTIIAALEAAELRPLLSSRREYSQAAVSRNHSRPEAEMQESRACGERRDEARRRLLHGRVGARTRPFARRHLFYQVIVRRYERCKLLLTTNQVEAQWGTVFGDRIVAAASLDRVLHHSHVATISGDGDRVK